MSERVAVAEFDWKYHIFLNIKNGGVGPKNFIVSLLQRCCLRLSRNTFLEGRSYVSLNEPPQVSKRLVFAEFNWKFHIF